MPKVPKDSEIKVNIISDPVEEKTTVTLNNAVVEAVAASGMYSISTQPAMLSNLDYSNAVANNNLSEQNAVANQQAVSEVGVSILGKAVSMISDLGSLESKSNSEIISGNTIAEQIGSLKASVQAFAGNQ